MGLKHLWMIVFVQVMQSLALSEMKKRNAAKLEESRREEMRAEVREVFKVTRYVMSVFISK